MFVRLSPFYIEKILRTKEKREDAKSRKDYKGMEKGTE